MLHHLSDNVKAGLIDFIALSVFVGTYVAQDKYFRSARWSATTRVAALDALSRLQEWSKWMASIQTAIVGGGGNLLVPRREQDDPML